MDHLKRNHHKNVVKKALMLITVCSDAFILSKINSEIIRRFTFYCYLKAVIVAVERKG